MLRARALPSALIVVGLTAAVSAHEPGLSALDVRVARAQIVVELSLAAPDVEEASRRGALDGPGGMALHGVEVSVDGRVLQLALDEAIAEPGGSVRVRLRSSRSPGSRLVVRSRVPGLLARGHRQLLTVRGEDGKPIAERMLDAGAGEAAVDLGAAGGMRGQAAAFFELGVEHILRGYDHLLFLAALLVVIPGIGDAIRTVTAFTVAHSLTLALTVLGVVEVPSAVVEPLIAASLVYVAAENILRPPAGGRWKLTGAFGLIHGFGFAGALRELGVGAGGEGVVAPLAWFNLGVEAGQAAVALAVVPAFTLVRSYPVVARPVARIGSTAVLCSGLFWLFERLA